VQPETRYARALIAGALLAWGISRALYVPPMLVGPIVPMLLVPVALEAVIGIVAGLGVWVAAGWAPLAVVTLGAIVAATAMIEAFVLGIIPYLAALVEAVVAVVVAILVAGYLRAPRP